MVQIIYDNQWRMENWVWRILFVVVDVLENVVVVVVVVYVVEVFTLK